MEPIMLKKENVNYIWNEVATLTSIARILESNFEKNNEIDTPDLWILITILKKNLISLNEYMNKIKI